MQNFSVAKEESISKVFPEETADPSKKVSITYEGPIHVNPSEAIFSSKTNFLVISFLNLI